MGKSYDILIQYNDLYLFFNRDKKTNRELEKKIDREKNYDIGEALHIQNEVMLVQKKANEGV